MPGDTAVHYGPNNLGSIVNPITRLIFKEITLTFREKLTIADESSNVFTGIDYRTGDHVNNDLALQFQGQTSKRAGFVLNLRLMVHFWRHCRWR